MTEIKRKIYYDKDYDINVHEYLTYAEIQAIVDSTEKLDSWSERQTNIDMLVLYYATDIGKEKIEEISHDKFLASGLITRVFDIVKNIDQIDKAFNYTESTARALSNIAKMLPKYQKQIESVIKNGAVRKK